mgnify:CR=1 FL=1|jgi:ribonucleotide reductase beta subunit family protein with ferritin-like domain
MAADPFAFTPEAEAVLRGPPPGGGYPPHPRELDSPEAKMRRVREWEKLFPDTPQAGKISYLYPATPARVVERWLAIGSNIAPELEAEEPLFRPEPGRCALFPLRDEELFAFRKTLERLHWVAQEVDLSRDKGDFEGVGEADRRLVESVLGFFSIADELVLEGLDGRLARALPTKEAAFYLRAQADQECVHSEAYSLQILEAIPLERREEIFEAVRTSALVGRMADWVRWWVLGRHAAADLFAAMAFIEGVMFSGFFAALHHYRGANLFPGITGLNEFICRDEGVHTMFWCFILTKRLISRPTAATVTAIARETVSLSCDFFTEALPEAVGGFSAALVNQYVRYAADSVAVQAGYEAIYGETNPFPFMDSLALNEVAKTNFFEASTSSYQNIGVEGALAFRVATAPLEEP